MFDKYSLEISKIFNGAEKEMLELKQPYVGTEHLMLSILKSCKEISQISKKYGLTYEKFKEELTSIIGTTSNDSPYVLYTPLLKRVIHAALDEASHNHSQLTPNYLFRAIFDEGEGIAIRIMLGMEVEIDKIYNSIKVTSTKTPNKNLEILSIGKILEEEINMNDKVIGREKELELVIETLIRKNKNNPLLVGDAGVGKTAIIEELTRRIKLGEVPSALLGHRIVALYLG
ncbi:MAG: hypothetical protein K2M17_02205 [Bacilli bacterium]|nr:hypothetical protein [Bacilli bacterium]